MRLHPTTRPDLDNLFKALTDSLNGLIWEDDSQIVQFEAKKTYESGSGTGPKILLTVEKV